MPFGAEHPVDPTILMLRDAHVIDIGGWHHILRHGDRFLPEAEVIDTVGRLCHGEERLTVGSLHAHHQQILVVPLDGPAVQGGVHHDALHQIRVVVLVEIVAPLQGSVLSREDRVFVFLVDTVPPLHGFVLFRQQRLMMGAQG